MSEDHRFCPCSLQHAYSDYCDYFSSSKIIAGMALRVIVAPIVMRVIPVLRH